MAVKVLNERKGRGPGRLNAEEAAGLEDRLLDAAVALFSEQGYGGTTIEQIARQAGASTKTLYSRYGLKSEILFAAVRRLMERTLQGEAPDASIRQDPRDYLIHLFTHICAWLATDALGLNRLVFSEGARFPELRRERLAAREHYVRLVRDALVRWRDQGLLPRLDDPDEAASLCLTMAVDRVLQSAVIGDPATPEETSRQIIHAVDFFLRGCGFEGQIPAKPSASRPRR